MTTPDYTCLYMHVSTPAHAHIHANIWTDVYTHVLYAHGYTQVYTRFTCAEPLPPTSVCVQGQSGTMLTSELYVCVGEYFDMC